MTRGTIATAWLSLGLAAATAYACGRRPGLADAPTGAGGTTAPASSSASSDKATTAGSGGHAGAGQGGQGGTAAATGPGGASGSGGQGGAMFCGKSPACDPGEEAKSCPSDCGVVALDAGFAFTCALLVDHSVRCWGSNALGQLGEGTKGNTKLVPVLVKAPGNATDVSAGNSHACAVLSGGAVWCWGDNTYSQLGDGTVNQSSIPVQVVGLPGAAVKVAAGSYHTCALLADKTVYCWGHDTYGQIGNGVSAPKIATPAAMLNASDVQLLNAGGFVSCVVFGNGTAWCAGYNNAAGLGNGSITVNAGLNKLTQVLNAADVTAIDVAGQHGCVAESGQAPRCWGSNLNGEVGDMDPTNPAVSSQAVSGSPPAIAVATGDFHTCAVVADGLASCWGKNTNGQLGTGDLMVTTSNVPIQVKDLTGATAVTAGSVHTCVLLKEKRVKCWGAGSSGQLGNGASAASMPAAGYVTGL